MLANKAAIKAKKAGKLKAVRGGGHRGALLLVLALAGEYFDITSGGPDASRPLLE